MYIFYVNAVQISKMHLILLLYLFPGPQNALYMTIHFIRNACITACLCSDLISQSSGSKTMCKLVQMQVNRYS